MLDVVETLAAAERVVREVQHVVGLMVRVPQLEQHEVLVDETDETSTHGHAVRGDDATVRRSAGSGRDLDPRPARRQHWTTRVTATSRAPQAACSSLLPLTDLTAYVVAHLKSLLEYQTLAMIYSVQLRLFRLWIQNCSLV